MDDCFGNICRRTCCDFVFILSADNLMDAIDVVAGPISPIGINRCKISGDSNGLLKVEPSVAFTKNLIEETNKKNKRK